MSQLPRSLALEKWAYGFILFLQELDILELKHRLEMCTNVIYQAYWYNRLFLTLYSPTHSVADNACSFILKILINVLRTITPRNCKIKTNKIGPTPPYVFVRALISASLYALGRSQIISHYLSHKHEIYYNWYTQ